VFPGGYSYESSLWAGLSVINEALPFGSSTLATLPEEKHNSLNRRGFHPDGKSLQIEQKEEFNPSEWREAYFSRNGAYRRELRESYIQEEGQVARKTDSICL
jgi:hypothetical protein